MTTSSTEKKLIPKFSTPTEQTRTIDGQPVTVRRLPARRAPDVLSRLLSDVKPVAVQMLSSPDEELDPAIEGAIRGMVASEKSTDAAVTMTVSVIKAIVFSDAISKVNGFDFGWYVSQMLPGCMSIAGVPIEKLDELDEAGIMPRTLWDVFRFACEVNFFPTFAGRDISDGPPSPSPTQPATANPIHGKSSLRGGSAKVGPKAQTSAG